MNHKRTFAISAAVFGMAIAFGAGVAVGENAAPSEPRGLKVSPATTLDLGSEIDGVQGRQLRLRVVTFEPGGAIPLHSHNGRPGVAYVLEGTVTEHVEGSGVHVHKQGENWTEGKATTHWAENTGDKPAVVVAVDVYKP